MFSRQYIPPEQQRHSIGDLVNAFGRPDPVIQEIFADGGDLSKVRPGYQYRAAQHSAAQMSANAFRLRKQAAIEAGTGTGKSFAVGVPAVLHAMETGQPVILSTSNNTLIDQYARTDLPTLQKALAPRLEAKYGRTFRFSVARGRSNTLCKSALHWLTKNGRGDKYPDAVRLIQEFADESPTGELADFRHFDLKNHALAPKIVATRSNCVGQKACSWGPECFYYNNRERWATADIILTNHAMLVISLILPPDSILPAFDGTIIDEAHQLERYVTDWLTTKVTPEKWRETMMDVSSHLHENCMFLADEFEEWFVRGVRPGRRPHAPEEILNQATVHMQNLRDLAPAKGVYETLREQIGAVEAVCSFEPKRDRASWVQADDNGEHITIHSAPTSVGGFLKSKLWHKPAVVTSATLCASKGEEAFDFIKGQLGLETRLTLQLASPFDWDRNCLYLYSNPAALREADVTKRNSETQEQWAKRWADKISPTIFKILTLTQGRAFVICTTTAVMDFVHANLLEMKLPYPILKQNELGKADTIDWFKSQKNPVLVATASYREGVDIPGAQLSAVIIDRIEFPNQNLPLEAARIKALGDSSFFTYQIPSAITILRQTVGRLLRTITDKGIVVILDPRLHTKKYGRQILSNLPGQAEAALDYRGPIDITGFLASPELVQAELVQAEEEFVEVWDEADIEELDAQPIMAPASPFVPETISFDTSLIDNEPLTDKERDFALTLFSARPAVAGTEPGAQAVEEAWAQIEGNGAPPEAPIADRFLGVLANSKLKTATRLRPSDAFKNLTQRGPANDHVAS